ncbi:hypothetical protein BCR35DRAFT_332698 [Leucosporidium creatinivorum]|uniref:Uncharacterized protein n=1 Tax=Leucosporidium creatinivorum TaxID=106004 RepID=A0A1Y2F0K1_9BASI|nr:hypothetical protein BCR35DRAFT_332698 [Leucosporidium creatinivorum]
MEAALQRSPFSSKHFWELVAADPPWSNKIAITYVLNTMHQFVSLWFSHPTSPSDPSYFLSIRDDSKRFKIIARTAQIRIETRQRRNDADGLSLAKQEDLKDDLHGEVDEGHSLAELLELPECKKELAQAVQHVYRRMMQAPKLADSHMRACAIVWKGYDGGISNLTRWQRMVVAIKAHEVAEHLSILKKSLDP